MKKYVALLLIAGISLTSTSKANTELSCSELLNDYRDSSIEYGKYVQEHSQAMQGEDEEFTAAYRKDPASFETFAPFVRAAGINLESKVKSLRVKIDWNCLKL